MCLPQLAEWAGQPRQSFVCNARINLSSIRTGYSQLHSRFAIIFAWIVTCARRSFVVQEKTSFELLACHCFWATNVQSMMVMMVVVVMLRLAQYRRLLCFGSYSMGLSV